MKIIITLIAIATVNFVLPTRAADPAAPSEISGMSMNPSKEDRDKMAAAHTQMATCLRSNQEFSQCHDALRTECKSMMGGSCSGMDMGNRMHKGMKNRK